MKFKIGLLIALLDFHSQNSFGQNIDSSELKKFADPSSRGDKMYYFTEIGVDTGDDGIILSSNINSVDISQARDLPSSKIIANLKSQVRKYYNSTIKKDYPSAKPLATDAIILQGYTSEKAAIEGQKAELAFVKKTIKESGMGQIKPLTFNDTWKPTAVMVPVYHPDTRSHLTLDILTPAPVSKEPPPYKTPPEPVHPSAPYEHTGHYTAAPAN